MSDRDVQALLGFAHAATGRPAPTPVEVEAWCAFDSLHELTLAEGKAAVVTVVEAHKARGDDVGGYLEWLAAWVNAAGRGLDDAQATLSADGVCGTDSNRPRLPVGSHDEGGER